MYFCGSKTTRTMFNFKGLQYQAQSCYIHACIDFALNIALHKIINKTPSSMRLKKTVYSIRLLCMRVKR